MRERFGKTDGLESTAGPQKDKVGHDPLALPPLGPTRHEHGPGYRGLGRNLSRAIKGNEAQRGLGGREAGWAGDSISSIPGLRLAAAATASAVFHSCAATVTDKRRSRAASAGTTRSIQQSAGATGEEETVWIRVRSVLEYQKPDRL